jgi:2'-5' RNA ligase
MTDQIKRLFFALEVAASWPEPLPAGRRLDKEHRHLTVAFLGETDYGLLKPLLPQLPVPPLQVGLVGIFNRCLFLPERHPHVVAWHVEWLEGGELLVQYQGELVRWLQERGFQVDVRKKFLPHVTLARSPFNPQSWKKSFTPLPMSIASLHLYESLGGLQYRSIWSSPILPPFVEIEHTADIAFQVYAENLDQLQLHALAALGFKCPSLLDKEMAHPESLDQLIIHLNDSISQLGAVQSCPFKAVSFHGNLERLENSLLRWEMIVDV